MVTLEKIVITIEPIIEAYNNNELGGLIRTHIHFKEIKHENTSLNRGLLKLFPEEDDDGLNRPLIIDTYYSPFNDTTFMLKALEMMSKSIPEAIEKVNKEGFQAFAVQGKDKNENM